ncbi:MAG: hypothetical protein M3T49_05345, partial [Candidatus Eremiobacteraeota bacterium]|nr:hypothetical protein [Candidatus Eremiobacteraeota bacterium]
MAISATHEATLACVFGDDEAARAALGGLLAAGVSAASLRVGARDPARASALVGESGVRCDVDPADPLRGMPG